MPVVEKLICKCLRAVNPMALRQFGTSGVLKNLGPVTRLSEDETMTRESVAKFARDEIAPRVKEMEKNRKIDSKILGQLFENGLMGMNIPQEYGGTGTNFMSVVLAVEELSKVDSSVAVLVDIQNTLNSALLVKLGTEAQKKRYLPLLASKWASSFCLSESGSGSDAFAMKTRATADGPDHFVIEGSKMWISNSDVANLFLVFANADPAKGYKGITCFLVERDNPGLKVGAPEDKFGLVASGTCQVFFENLRIPRTNVLGEVGHGYRYAAGLLNEGRIGIGAQMLGICEACLDATIDYTLDRKQFGQDLFSFQAVQHQLAHLDTEVECARLLVYNAARRVDAGLEFVREASMCKYYSSELAQRLTSKCIDLMGGVGFTKDYPHEKFLRDCKAGTIYEGTSHIQLSTIAKHMKNAHKK